ncbi:MAG: PilZ domain-containing protein [Candidatus Manganitrophus sp.]|nr:PilZ domain-containing protein [Candidatus Manganitrophus sp.]
MSSLTLNDMAQKAIFNPPRENKRVVFNEEILLWKGTSLQTKKPPRSAIIARAKNISNGGVCLVTKTKLEINQFLRMTFKLKSVPINIPTLVEVRWVEKVSDSYFRVGARFIY